MSFHANELDTLIRVLENKQLETLEKLRLLKTIIYFMFYTKGVMV